MNISSGRRRVVADRDGSRRHRPDYWLLMLSVALLAIGMIVVYAIGPSLSAQSQVSENYYASKQLIAILLGAVAFLITANVPISYWRKLEKPLIAAAVLSAGAVQAFGEEVNGAARWVHIGGLSFQAVELIKFALLIWLAGFLANRQRDNNLTDYHKSLKPMIIVLATITIVVGLVESDLGSTGVIVAIMAAMVFVAGMPFKKILAITGIVMIATALLVAVMPYRRDRLTTFLNPEADCLNTGYQACQALYAIGSGGMFGKGLGRSIQANGYLPEAANDSIFAIYAEKFGFVGVMVLLGLFTTLFIRLFRIVERAPNEYVRLIVTGILAWLTTQAIINIGAMLGLLPLKGITLPFISYGGTSVLFVTGVMGMAFQISRYTTYGISINNAERGRNEYRSNRRGFRGAYHPNPERS